MLNFCSRSNVFILILKTGKTENQAEQLQNLVRDNFPLFVRCAEGFEEFRRSSEQEVGLGVNERIEKLEAIAESSAYQAKKSFKPLLDNTSEVRKVQSALAVLNRVGPILQVPALMRQHIENRRYSQALKTYRRALVIDESCNIELLKLVKKQAEECVRDARIDLERRLTQDPNSSSIDDLLNSIRDLGELLELDVTIPESKSRSSATEVDDKNKKDPGIIIKEQEDNGLYSIGGSVLKIREHPPALACLLLQAAHFGSATNYLIRNAEETSQRIYAGETLSQVQNSDQMGNNNSTGTSPTAAAATSLSGVTPNTNDKSKAAGGAGNQWKYDVLDARVVSTNKAVDTARVWLPRLVRIGKAAREDEKRRAARIGHRRRAMRNIHDTAANQVTSFEVFVSTIAPSLNRLVEHAAFCALGSNTRTGAKYVEMTYGQNAEEKLRTLLRSPLPPSQSTKVGKELADLVQLLSESAMATDDLRPNNSMYKSSPLEACQRLGDSAVVTIEKRRCIYAFDVCSRSCSNRASGSGKFDADALLQCLRNLSEQLSRPEECSNEVEKGCELVVRRCCEGLAGFVRDRGDDARLSAVAECSDVMAERIDEVIREVGCLTKNSQAVRDVVIDDIMGLESAMFDEYLESIRQHVANSVKVGWLDKDTSAVDSSSGEHGGGEDSNQPPSFPAYLSASLLAIARCRAQVEQALGNRIRRTTVPSGKDTQSPSQQLTGVPYQHLSMATVADGVIEGICNEIMKRKLKLKVRQADRLANELEFLSNTLKKFLNSDETRVLLKSTLQMVCTKAGRSSSGGRDYQDHDGPDGLAALEELERLGRVYVLCLGD
jgi:Exocyst complex component Sec5